MTFSNALSVINFTAVSASSQSDNCLSTLSSSSSLTSEGGKLEGRDACMIELTKNSESYQLPVARELLHTPGIRLQTLWTSAEACAICCE
jgi:hypothetical protein